MNRYKRLFVLLGALAVACIATFVVLQMEQYQEKISNSGETVLELPADEVESVSWDYDGVTLSFHREDDGWQYDDDAAFPVDAEAIDNLLEPFTAFGASFIIEQVEDYGQYGLDDPLCTIRLETADESYEITLGDYSSMDAERYVSTGDGNVYLAADDPLNYYDVTLHDMIDNDETPAFDEVSQIAFTGSQAYTIDYETDSADTYREEDVYFVQQEQGALPLDTDRVEDYLDTIRFLGLSDYMTYTASQDDLSVYGLDDPDLTVAVTYTASDEDGGEQEQTFTLAVSRDPEEDADDDEITAYARVGQSEIVYLISGTDYESLMAASCDDLRHTEVLPADLADVSRIDVTLEDNTYTLTCKTSDDEQTVYYQDEEVESDDLQRAIEALQADSFTDQTPDGKEEIALTCYLDLDGEPAIDITFYRCDGSFCLAEVDGEPVSLVARSAVVDLIEAVHAIVLA